MIKSNSIMLLLSLFLHNLFGAIGNQQFQSHKEFNVRPPENFRPNEISKQILNSEATRGICESFVLKLSYNRIKIAAKPKGLCRYCCRPTAKNDINFFIYTKDNTRQGKLLSYTKAGNAAAAGLNPNNPTVIFIHGFLELSPDGVNGNTIKEAYFSRPEPYNVVIMDWSNLSVAPWYMEASQNTRYVAKTLARFLKRFHESGEVPINTVHLVGFSLGAHIAGFSGRYLKGLRIPRITGLDVASPGFPLNIQESRLCKDDAEFVDVIHTNPRWLGFPTSIGDVDFYVNDAEKSQPGCSLETLSGKNQLDDFFSCSHQRSVQVYAESVRNPEAFPATKCKHFKGNNRTCEFITEAYMGFNVSREARGDHFLVTRDNIPFSLDAQQQRYF